MVSDLQGVRVSDQKWILTDPQVLSSEEKLGKNWKKGRFGRADMGDKGIREFFQKHKCTTLCKKLGNTLRPPTEEERMQSMMCRA